MYKSYLNHLKSVNISKDRHQEKLASNINNKTIRSHLDKIINEFNILPKKLKPLSVVKYTAKILLWTTVYVAFSYLTITSSFEVIQQYRDNPMTTNMKAIINNNVTYLPNITICFKINTSELLNISSSSSFNYTSAWYQFFEETVSPEGIFRVIQSQIYDDEIYLSLLKYLAMIYEAERAWEPGLTQIFNFLSEKSDDWVALREVLMPNIERYNITLEQLKSVFDGKFCSLPASRPYSYSYLLNLAYLPSGKTECMTGSKISFIGMDTVCFRLIGYENYLRKLGTTDFIDLYLYDDYKNQTWCQELTIDLGSESRSAPRRATTRNETYTYYYNRFPSFVLNIMDIRIKALYRKLPYVKGEIQCSSDTSREECENECLRGWIRANCHCSPITFNLTADTSGYRNCTVDEYSICLKKYTENATYLCTDKCVPLCEQWHYEYNLALLNATRYGYVEIRTKTFDYVIIEQVFSWNSFEEFIGALGGALGIWLGLDFVIIIEFIVNLLKRLGKKILLRNIHNAEEEKHEESGNIKNREENVDKGVSPSNETGNRVAGQQKEYKENESDIDGSSIRQINESEKQRRRRKKRESNTLKEKHMQQRRKSLNSSRANSAILGDKMKNSDANYGSQRNHKVNITENVGAVQDQSNEHANYSSAHSLFLQKMLASFTDGAASTSKPAMFLRFVEILFWVVIYLVGSVFTTLWCVELIKVYSADEAIYYPSLIINRTALLPPPSLCINYNTKLFFDSHGKTSYALIDYFGQSDINRTSFTQIHNGKAWPEQLVSIGILYLSTLSEFEVKYDDYFTSEYERRLFLLAGYDSLVRNDVNKSVRAIFLPKLLEWNVTANELRQKLGAELARMAELKISFTNSSGTIDIVNETSFYTTAITDESFCYGLSKVINFTDPDDTLEFSINRASYPELLPSRPSYIFFSDYLLEPENAQSRFTQYSLTVFDSTYFKFEYGYALRTLISVDGLYTSRPAAKGVKQCSPNTTKSYCRAQCRIKLIENVYNCSPTYWAMMIPPNSGLDECTFDRYMGCLNFNASIDLGCQGSCLSSCTAEYFRKVMTLDYRSQKYKDTAVARFSVKNGISVSIEEQQTFTFINFLTTVLLDT